MLVHTCFTELPLPPAEWWLQQGTGEGGTDGGTLGGDPQGAEGLPLPRCHSLLQAEANASWDEVRAQVVPPSLRAVISPS